MTERCNWVVPTFNYELRSDKPPLHYYFMMLSYKIFGVNEFSSRVFSAFFGALTLLITFLFVRKYSSEKKAIFTTLILLASLNLSLEFHLAVPDPYLIFFLVAAHFLFFEFFVNRKPWTLTLMYISLALATLVKGPIAFGLLGLNGFVFLLFKRALNRETIRAFKLYWGILIMLIITLPWFVLVGIDTNWEWQKEFFLEQNLNRLTQEMEGHGGFWGLTILYVFVAFLPFAFFLIQSFIYSWKEARKNDLYLFAIITSLVTILFFSFSATKLPNYPMPAYPFVALILSHYFTSKEIKHFRILLFITFLTSLLFPLSIYFALHQFEELKLLSAYAFLVFIIPMGNAVALWMQIRKKSQEKVISTLAVTWVILSFIIFLWFFPAVSRLDPVQNALPVLNRSKPFGYYRRCNSGFEFYLKKPIKKLITLKEVKDFMEKHPDAYLISAKEYEDELKGLSIKKIFQMQDLFESPITVIYKVEK